ncbi:MAG: AAA family ATPase [Candidatus Moranbacteria bacterium]|nr:AAA family ATPase [Candidatus Moranbacteria bacterium]
MVQLIDSLNQKQKQAAATIQGPVLVLAGAGSGKTRTLTYRIANMIKTGGIEPDSILAVTFTNKAAREMRERLASLIVPHSHQANQNFLPGRNFPFIGTFHAFCLRVLKEDIEKLGYKKNFNIADDKDQLSIIKLSIKKIGQSPDKLNPKAVSSKISGFKNQLLTPRAAQNKADDYFLEQSARVYAQYQRYLQANNLVDFDDIIMKTVELWRGFQPILTKYQKRYPYVLVDEYQDTNHAQYTLIQLLVKPNKNIFVVGDDYQSIYAWRGANIQNILNFEADYPEAQVILLEQNYRSTNNILQAAQSVIDQNPNQKPKKLWTQNSTGSRIFYYQAADEEEEAEFILDEIDRLCLRKKCQHRDFAVLYRINAQSRMLEEKFITRNIPYRIVGGIKFYQRAEIKDLIAYLRLAADFSDRLSFERIINTPRRSIGKQSLDKILAFAADHKLNYIQALEKMAQDPRVQLPKTKAKVFQNFANFIRKIKRFAEQKPLKDVIQIVIKQSGYADFLISLGREGEVRYENTLELLSVAEKYKHLAPAQALDAFLEEAVLATSEDNPDQNQNVVTLMTLHSAKGLEFPYVFIPGFEQGILPHSRSLENPFEMQEERRLCYVGITRAMQRLWLISVRNRQLFGQVARGVVSDFLEEIPENLLKKKQSPPKIAEYQDYPATDSDFYDEHPVIRV